MKMEKGSALSLCGADATCDSSFSTVSYQCSISHIMNHMYIM
jgi:hypothetical protein